MSDIVSRKALLECLKKEAELCIKEKFDEKKTRFYLGRETALTDIIRQIESGRFDLPSAESEGEARDSNMEYLRRRNDSLTKRISAYRDENEWIQAENERLRMAPAIVKEIQELLHMWNFRGIAEEKLESYEKGVTLELIDCVVRLVDAYQTEGG